MATINNTATPAPETAQTAAPALTTISTSPSKDKVSIRIPFDAMNKEDSYVPVCINGYIYQIKRGEDVEVPTQVRQLLCDAGYI